MIVSDILNWCVKNKLQLALAGGAIIFGGGALFAFLYFGGGSVAITGAYLKFFLAKECTATVVTKEGANLVVLTGAAAFTFATEYANRL